VGVHKSTISREIRRNRYGNGSYYAPDHAIKKAKKRAGWRKGLRRITPQMKSHIKYCLTELHYSPEQISGRCRSKGIKMVSTESIYQYIWRDKRYGGTLYTYLSHRGRRYRKRGSSYSSRSIIPGRVDIGERPDIVDRRERFGDFEIDTIVGATQSQHMLTIVERKTGMVWIRKLEKATAENTAKALIEALRPLALKKMVFTITSDNGKLFSNHADVSAALNASFFFARPYHSWERGSNENTNGLIRKFFPKKSNFDLITEQDVMKVEKLLNNRPRKRFDFLTPIEYFNIVTKNEKKVAFRT